MLVLYAGWGSKTASDSLAYARLAFKSLLYVALPAWIIMRVGAGWIYEKEFGDVDSDPTWVGIGFIAAEPGALLLLIAIVLGGLSARQAAQGRRHDGNHGQDHDRARDAALRRVPHRRLGDGREAHLEP